MWDVATAAKLYTFEGHEAAVHSVCPHYKENVHVRTLLDTQILLRHIYLLSMVRLMIFFLQFVFSTSVDGKIKAWLYDIMGSRVDYYAPGHSCATMAYSADGKRFVCRN